MSFIHKFDKRVMDFIQDHCRIPVLDSFMQVVTKLGDLGFVWLMIAAYLFRDRRYESMQLFLSIACCCVLCNLIMKPFFKRERPFETELYGEEEVDLLIREPEDHSFPSGHTMASFTAAASLALLFGRGVGTAAFLLAFLIGWSRLYLFVHHPSDVLAGMIFGSILGTFCTLFCGGIAEALVEVTILLIGY